MTDEKKQKKPGWEVKKQWRLPGADAVILSDQMLARLRRCPPVSGAERASRRCGGSLHFSSSPAFPSFRAQEWMWSLLHFRLYPPKLCQALTDTKKEKGAHFLIETKHFFIHIHIYDFFLRKLLRQTVFYANSKSCCQFSLQRWSLGVSPSHLDALQLLSFMMGAMQRLRSPANYLHWRTDRRRVRDSYRFFCRL